MINLDYINGSISLEAESIFRPYESFMESCKNDIDMIFVDISMLEEKVALESTIMGSVPEKMMMVYESEKKNIFTRIGEMIITIYNKFAEFIDNIIDKIKTYSFKKKSDLQKLDILLKNHPELKNEAIAAFNEGALDLSDVKSLKELDSAFDEILKMARKKDIDPKTLRGKWEKAKENFNKDSNTWKVVKVAGAATTIITAAIAVKTFSSKCAKATNDAQKDKQSMRELKAQILSNLKEEGAVTDDTGKWQTVLQIWRELNGKHSAVRNEHLTVIDRLSNGIVSFVDKFDKDGGKRLHSDLQHAADNKYERERRELNYKMKTAQAEAYHRAKGTEAARNEKD